MTTMIDDLEATWRARHSSRAFLPEPLPADDIRRMFAAAQAAPSWCNVQPWRVVTTSPPTTTALATALQDAAKLGRVNPELMFPVEYPEPYARHRVECGVSLYKAMGVARDDRAGRYAAWLRNYALFGAPHAAIISCDRRLGAYAYVDVGVWLGYLLTAAAAMGIATCPLASVAALPDTLRAHLPIGEHDLILFGLAFGRADEGAAANAGRTARAPVETNVTFV